jgi:hypothetical protein
MLAVDVRPVANALVIAIGDQCVEIASIMFAG